MRRPDGKKIKGISGFDRILSLIVGKTRNETTNFWTTQMSTLFIDPYIEEKRKEGMELTYRDIIISLLVRVFYLRPRLNRFVVGGNFYQRNFIDVAVTLHKNLRTGDGETAIKCRFTGKETIYEIKKQLDEKIDIAMNATNDTDDFSRRINWMPTWLLRLFVRCFRGLDRLGLLSDKFLLNTSPFHASIFFADLKSIHLGKIYHHLYNFGNCGFFCTMGKEKQIPIVDEKTGEIKIDKIFELGVSIDERFIDGFYYSGMIKLVNRILENLHCLDRAPHDDEIKKEKPKSKKKKNN